MIESNSHESPQDATTIQAAVRALRTQWRTRELLDATARLMARDGFERVSMQALATEAEVSVGLIYRYFSGKQDLLEAVIVDVLDAFEAEIPRAIASGDRDPVEAMTRAFGACCRVIDEHRQAALLTYRESKSLSEAGLERIKALEIQSSEPLRQVIREAIDAGRLIAVDPEILAFDLLLLAHGWALKHWYFERSLDLDSYIACQNALVLRSVIDPKYQHHYRHLTQTQPQRSAASQLTE